MPEGDTIARLALRLRPLLVGEDLLEVRHRGARVRDLEGERVVAIETHGKHLWVRLGEVALHVHLGMEGRVGLWSPRAIAEEPWRLRGAALLLRNRLGCAAWHRTPVVEVVRGPDAREPARRAGLGPDVMGDGPDLEEMVRRARAPEQRDRALGEVLLDQRIAAGIGNLWKSELCFVAGLDPRAPVGGLPGQALRDLFARATTSMKAALASGAGDATTASGTRGRPGRFVYRRAGRPCLRCGTAIERIVQGPPPGRSTYLCPSCQRGG